MRLSYLKCNRFFTSPSFAKQTIISLIRIKLHNRTSVLAYEVKELSIKLYDK